MAVHPQDGFEFHSCKENPERVGLVDLIAMITAHQDVKGRVLIFTDSGLGALSELNERKVPISGDLYLPENTTLAYAAGDRGTDEFIGNRGVATCDRISSDFLDGIAAKRYPVEYLIREGAPFQKFRYLRAPDVRAWGADHSVPRIRSGG